MRKQLQSLCDYDGEYIPYMIFRHSPISSVLHIEYQIKVWHTRGKAISGKSQGKPHSGRAL